MVGSKKFKASFVCVMIGVIFQSLSTPAYGGRSVLDVSEQKNYYSPSTPHGSSSPKHSSPSSPACPTPSGGGHSGGGHSTPSTPSHGGGGHSTPSTPSHGGGSGNPYAPPSYGGTPSTTPGTPSATPGPAEPSPPVMSSPNVPPFHPGTCSYWTAHPDKIVSVIGHFGTVGDFFGAACVFAYGGKNPTLHDAVANTNTDGFGALLREGTTALLNSLSCKTFPLTQQQVRAAFVAALGNDGAAAAQAAVFKIANEGK